MQFKAITGQEEVKAKLRRSVKENRVAHTQLLLGPEGSGSFALAIAFAQYINCKQKTGEDSCGKCPSCIKFELFSHPDLHFFFPTTTTTSVKKDPRSALFLNIWRDYLSRSAGYPAENDWYKLLNVGNKQGYIRKDDANELIQKISLKSFEAEYRTIVIWRPERINEVTSNKLLKTFEEPPAKTLIFLIGEQYDMLLPTIRSRAQLIKVPKLKDADIAKALYSKTEANEEQAKEIAVLSNGSWNTAMDIYENVQESRENFDLFRNWLRLCYNYGNYTTLNKLNSELAGLGRERQKRFLSYGLDTIHNSLLHNSGNHDRVRKSGEELEFSHRFAPYIHENNRTEIYQLLNEAIYHIERNAHAGILFTDLSLKIGTQLKKKAATVS